MKHVEGTAYTFEDLTKEDQEKLRSEVVQVYVGNYGRIPSDEEINTAVAVICCMTLGNPWRESKSITPRVFFENVWKFVEPSPDGKSICGIPHPIPSVSIQQENN